VAPEGAKDLFAGDILSPPSTVFTSFTSCELAPPGWLAAPRKRVPLLGLQVMRVSARFLGVLKNCGKLWVTRVRWAGRRAKRGVSCPRFVHTAHTEGVQSVGNSVIHNLGGSGGGVSPQPLEKKQSETFGLMLLINT
jgi:hypothetical protein